ACPEAFQPEISCLGWSKVRERLKEELAFQSGLHRTYISGVERGVRNPTVLVLEQIANALGISPAQLLE
ncbi:helix-turn-helix domain-containing protein, partial [Caenispirillum bisanense]|uniref:helix-turn-helix domain-containing protein n=1 Tax=Caenispirillum bisanense TaxID=414052 RepID=UPI003CD0A8B9